MPTGSGVGPGRETMVTCDSPLPYHLGGGGGGWLGGGGRISIATCCLLVLTYYFTRPN